MLQRPTKSWKIRGAIDPHYACYHHTTSSFPLIPPKLNFKDQPIQIEKIEKEYAASLTVLLNSGQ